MYQSQAQLLDLFGDVNLVHENGTRFVTNTAHVDVAADSAEGNDPVTGHGPSGDITAQGFRVLDKGNTIVFTGKSNLLLKGTKPSAHPAASPPTLPAEVAATRRRSKRLPWRPSLLRRGYCRPNRPLPPVRLPPRHPTPAAKPDPAVQSPSMAKRDVSRPRQKPPWASGRSAMRVDRCVTAIVWRAWSAAGGLSGSPRGGRTRIEPRRRIGGSADRSFGRSRHRVAAGRAGLHRPRKRDGEARDNRGACRYVDRALPPEGQRRGKGSKGRGQGREARPRSTASMPTATSRSRASGRPWSAIKPSMMSTSRSASSPARR